MNKRISIILLVLALAAIAVPAVADHANEPTAPVTGLTVRMYEYINPTTTRLKCDGTDKITFDQVRIEPGVSVAGKPSEHFTVNMSVTFTERLNGAAATTFKQWGTEWRHQNVAPHGFGGISLDKPWEVAQTNQYLHGRLGFWIVTHRVTGDESGLVFNHTCTFERVAG